MGDHITEASLRRKFWWWRRGTRDWTFDEATSTTRMKECSKDVEWKSGRELIAWWYELVIRHTPDTQMPRHPKADEVMLALLEDFSPSRACRSVLRVDALPVSENHLIRNQLNWTDIWKIQCELTATDHEIARAFLRLVHEARKKRGIKSSKGAEGTRHRPVSWRWPELLDIYHHVKQPKLNHADRSKLSRARSLSATLAAYISDQLTPAPEDEDLVGTISAAALKNLHT
jgi:hypothetical protein